ncbi:MAG TPA: cupin domain-containing protein [Puia sp.]|jgi:quercetin dioxygenase-like cupin family protein|nr:cupin domain-containing protein [Puia sp.]
MATKPKLPKVKVKDQKIKVKLADLVKSKSHVVVEIIEYVPHSVVAKSILKKLTGSVSVMSFDNGEGLTEKTSPFDTFAQIIEGKANIVIDKVSHLLQTGMGIIIPAHSANYIKPNGRFKMILTLIKSGYE